MSTVMGGVVVTKVRLKKKRKGLLAQSSEPTSTAPCISSAVGAAHAGERDQDFEGLPYDYDPGDPSSMRGVVAVAVVVTSVEAEGSHTDSTVSVAQSPALDLALGEAVDSDT